MKDPDPLQKLGSQQGLATLHILRSEESVTACQTHANPALPSNFVAIRAINGTSNHAAAFCENKRETGKLRTISPHLINMPEWSERFTDKVSDSAFGCWEWMSSKTPLGYGQFSIGNFPRYAHRLAYELWRGVIPAGMSVLHTCDNPSCVNPDHLWLGTQADNMRDRRAKGWHLKDRAAKRLSPGESTARQYPGASTG